MRYLDFRDRIQEELRAHPDGLTWAQLKARLDLPYRQPCPEWVKRMEAEVGLSRARGAGRAFVWTLVPGDRDWRTRRPGKLAVTVRKERAGDEPLVYEVNCRAFGRKEEAEVVESLRRSCPEAVSLVAEVDGVLVGHILFTPATIEGDGTRVSGAGLAPLAVLPASQGRGIGSALVRAGLEVMRQAGTPFVVVIGHPGYYPRFGFERASERGIRCEYELVPDDAWLIAVLDEGAMNNAGRVAKQRPEFSAAM